MELSNYKIDRTHKLAHDPRQVEACLLAMGTNIAVESVLGPRHEKNVSPILNNIRRESVSMSRPTKIIIVNSNALIKKKILKNTKQD